MDVIPGHNLFLNGFSPRIPWLKQCIEYIRDYHRIRVYSGCLNDMGCLLVHDKGKTSWRTGNYDGFNELMYNIADIFKNDETVSKSETLWLLFWKIVSIGCEYGIMKIHPEYNLLSLYYITKECIGELSQDMMEVISLSAQLNGNVPAMHELIYNDEFILDAHGLARIFHSMVTIYANLVTLYVGCMNAGLTEYGEYIVTIFSEISMDKVSDIVFNLKHVIDTDLLPNMDVPLYKADDPQLSQLILTEKDPLFYGIQMYYYAKTIDSTSKRDEVHTKIFDTIHSMIELEDYFDSHYDESVLQAWIYIFNPQLMSYLAFTEQKQVFIGIKERLKEHPNELTMILNCYIDLQINTDTDPAEILEIWSEVQEYNIPFNGKTLEIWFKHFYKNFNSMDINFSFSKEAMNLLQMAIDKNILIYQELFIYIRKYLLINNALLDPENGILHTFLEKIFAVKRTRKRK